MRVGRYFVQAEFGNVPAAAVPSLGTLCALYLDPLRDQFGPCTVISGARTPARNKQVGGAPESRHIYSERPLEVAADVVFRRGSPVQWHRAAKKLQARARRGGVGYYDSHLHVDIGPRRNW